MPGTFQSGVSPSMLHSKNGPESQALFLRPYNNGRFHPGPPLKEHLGVAIGYTAAGGSYLELSLDGLLVAAGLHHPATDQLERVRAAIDDDRRRPVVLRGSAGPKQSELEHDPWAALRRSAEPEAAAEPGPVVAGP